MTDEQAVCLLRAIREHSSLELSSIRDAGTYGADSGFGGFTYTSDGADFTAGNRELIWSLLQEDADDFGADSVLTFVADFTRSDMADSPLGFDCLLAWYALEKAGHWLNDRREARGA
jgi:hypothetical protein